jgi:hypothetical protein
MSRLDLRQLGKVHIASFVNPGFAVRAVGGELVAEIRQPRLPAIPPDQPSDGFTAVAPAPAAADFEETGCKVAEGE